MKYLKFSLQLLVYLIILIDDFFLTGFGEKCLTL